MIKYELPHCEPEKGRSQFYIGKPMARRASTFLGLACYMRAPGQCGNCGGSLPHCSRLPSTVLYKQGVEKEIMKKMRTIGLCATSLVLALSLAGCSVGVKSSDSSSEAQQVSQKKEIQYYEQCEELPTPEGIINATKTSMSSLSSGGISSSAIYNYSIDSDSEEEASGQVASYIDALADYGFEAVMESETEWNVVKDDVVVANVSFGAEDLQLRVEVFTESGRTKLINITLGQTAEEENYTFTLTGIEWSKEIYPSDTSGYYKYYQEQPNKTYCVVKGTFKNTGANDFDLKNTSLEFKNMNGKYNFTGSPSFEYVSYGIPGIGNIYSIEPLTEVPLYLYASISDEVANNFTGGTMTWTFRDGNTYSLNFQ